MADQTRVGVNPLPWIFGSDFSWNCDEPTIRGALSDLQKVGFRALHADVPAGMSAGDYRDMLAEYDFVPAPGYFAGYFENRADHGDLAEQARTAAAVQAELGLTEMFIANHLSPERRTTPAVGADPDAGRLETVTDGLVAAAEAMQSEGVAAALHPHVGSCIEVEAEVRAVLDRSAGTALRFGPDTGHLYWAGVDPAGLIGAYADRVIAMHLKDVDSAVRDATKTSGADYAEATFTQHVWAEPGRGSIDFDAVFAALPSNYAGWVVVEVDVPNLPDRVESARASFDWVVAHPHLVGSPA